MSNQTPVSIDTKPTAPSSEETYKIVFSLLRSALWGEVNFPFDYDRSTNWSAINKELRTQTVQILPVDILVKADPKHSTIYLQSTAKSIRSWYTLMQEQQTLYNIFKEAGIPIAILKGAGADYYYPQPSYRRMGDIDFIVRPADFDRATQLMEEQGYTTLDSHDFRHTEYKKNGVVFEMHRTFAVLNEEACANWLDNKIHDSLDNIQEQSMDGFSFPMLPTLENGLVLLCHINQHLEKGLGLRQITDWMLYVNKELPDEYWNATFADAADNIGLKTLAITVTRMCQMYLGLPDTITWCQQANTDLCHNLMAYIMDQGNFGCKHSQESSVAMNTLAIKNLRELFHILQHRGMDNWKACQKYPFLKPFAWIYQISRYVRKGMEREKPLKQLRDEYAQTAARDELLNNLKVTRRSKGITLPNGKQRF